MEALPDISPIFPCDFLAILLKRSIEEITEDTIEAQSGNTELKDDSKARG